MWVRLELKAAFVKVGFAPYGLRVSLKVDRGFLQQALHGEVYTCVGIRVQHRLESLKITNMFQRCLSPAAEAAESRQRLANCTSLLSTARAIEIQWCPHGSGPSQRGPDH
jgi:hypothetical protein